MYQFIDILTSNPLKYKLDYPILNVSICLRKSIRMKTVTQQLTRIFVHTILLNFLEEKSIFKNVCSVSS